MMNTISVVAFLICIAAIIGAIVVPKTKNLRSAFLKTAAATLVIGFVTGCITIVPTGYTGVKTTFGQVSDTALSEGFNITLPLIQQVQLVNNKLQDLDISGSQIWGETSEKTPVYASDIVVSYRIQKEKSAWLYINVSNVDNVVSSDIVSSALKSAMVRCSATDVTNRSVVEPIALEEIQNSLDNKYGEGVILVSKVVINQMDFEESYNEAIAEKSIATQTYEKQAIENKTAIEKAEADKKVALLNAEAEAEAAKIKAEAEAEANKLISESLTDTILRNKYFEKWNGVLPEVVSGGDSSLIYDLGNNTSEPVTEEAAQ